MKKIYINLAIFLSGILGMFFYAQFSLAQTNCSGECMSVISPPTGYVADSSGDASCAAVDASKPNCFVKACTKNSGTCVDSGKCSSGNILSSYNSSCSSSQVCCKNTSTTTPSTSGSSGSSGKGIEIPSDTGLPDPSGGILAIVKNFLNWLLTIFLILAVIAFVITGIQYLLAMGNARSNTLESAKKNFNYSLLAVIIVGAGLIILKAIDNFLRASSTI